MVFHLFYFFLFFFSFHLTPLGWIFQVAMLGGADESLSEIAFQYGRNVGLAFQLVDDLLDFVSSSEAMGKPTAADLKLGLATAPVLFACEKVCIIFLFFTIMSCSKVFTSIYSRTINSNQYFETCKNEKFSTLSFTYNLTRLHEGKILLSINQAVI